MRIDNSRAPILGSIILWCLLSLFFLEYRNLIATTSPGPNLKYDTFLGNESIAIVFKIGNIARNDYCLCQRFVALLEGTLSDGYDVILLHEPEASVSQPLVDYVSRSKHSQRVQILSNPSGANFTRNKKDKFSFLLWAMHFRRSSKKPSHYWVVEDDVYWTGKWSTFFRAYDERLNNGTLADYVTFYRMKQPKQWFWSKTCKVNGQGCIDKKSGRIQQDFNNLFRISDRFLAYLSDLLIRGMLQGHDEANFGAAFNLWNRTKRMEPPQRHVQLFPPGDALAAFQGIDVLGGSSAWQEEKYQPVYSLRGLANIYIQNETLGREETDRARLSKVAREGLTRYKSNMEVPRNKIFHPVKCLADRSVGRAALAFALEVDESSQPFKRKMKKEFDLACPTV